VDAEIADVSKLPTWIQQRMKLSRQALQEVARKRGKSLRVYKGLDTLGV
jgi:hypothetical protein